ncbi:hypothetical protein ACFX2C_031336 [Malus domestica]
MELSPLHAQSSASSLIHGWVQWQHRAFAEGRKDFDTRHYLLTQSCGCEIHFSKDSCDNAYFSLKALLAELLESFENPQQSAGIPASYSYIISCIRVEISQEAMGLEESRFMGRNSQMRTWKHIGPGILSMANSRPNTNAHPFFICTAMTPCLEGKHVVFETIVDGYNVVEQMKVGSKSGT